MDQRADGVWVIFLAVKLDGSTTLSSAHRPRPLTPQGDFFKNTRNIQA